MLMSFFLFWTLNFCLPFSSSVLSFPRSSLMCVFHAYWISVGWFFVTPLVNSRILFRQVHQLTHKAPSILHTCWICQWLRHPRCVRLSNRVVTRVQLEWFSIYNRNRRTHGDVLMTSWRLEVCSANQFSAVFTILNCKLTKSRERCPYLAYRPKR